MPRSHTGFTLVEVLVALAVLAIALAAVMRAMAQSVDTTVTLREHNMALWVAQNQLATHQMRQDWPAPDTIDGEAEMGGMKWYWREQVSATPEPQMRRIEITVRSRPDSKDTRAKLVGYLRNKIANPASAPAAPSPGPNPSSTPAPPAAS
jgi:general secretion pathway protein I